MRPRAAARSGRRPAPKRRGIVMANGRAKGPVIRRRCLGVVAAALAVGCWAGRASAQVGLRDITQPIPVVNPGGHGAPVRSLIFASPDGSRLLSGGLDKVVNVWEL